MILSFFFNDTATTEIYTLSLHDALPISRGRERGDGLLREPAFARDRRAHGSRRDGPGYSSVRSEEHTLNSSHANISYAVFCLKKKKTTATNRRPVKNANRDAHAEQNYRS